MFLTKRSYLLMGGAVVLAAALVTGAAVHADRPESMTVPEQTPIHITLDQAVSSDQNRSGDHFQATVTEPVDVNGKTVIPQGAHVEGLIVDARKSGRLMGRAQLRMDRRWRRRRSLDRRGRKRWRRSTHRRSRWRRSWNCRRLLHR